MRRNSFTTFQVHAIHMAFRGCGIGVSGTMLLVVEEGVLYCYDLILAQQKVLADTSLVKEESEFARHRLGAARSCLISMIGSFCSINGHDNIAEVEFALSSEDIPDASQHHLEVVA